MVLIIENHYIHISVYLSGEVYGDIFIISNSYDHRP